MSIKKFATSANSALTCPLLPSLPHLFRSPLRLLLSLPVILLPLPPASPSPNLLPFPSSHILPSLLLLLLFPLPPSPLPSPCLLPFLSLFHSSLALHPILPLLPVFPLLSLPLSPPIAPNLLTIAGWSSMASWRRRSPRRQSGGGTSLSASSPSRPPSLYRRTPLVARPLRYWRRNRSTRCPLSARQGGWAQSSTFVVIQHLRGYAPITVEGG